MRDSQTFVQHLSEALPYLQKFYGKILVIKYGGAAMHQASARDAFIRDLVLLRTVGIKPVVVHGGGPMITEMLTKVGKTTEFIHGLRVTDRETVNITEMVLAGVINKGIVASINRAGGRAVGISGKDGNLIEAVKHMPRMNGDDPDRPPEGIDIGYVGEVHKVNPEVLLSLDEAGFIPVVAPLGAGGEGETYNINADTVAGAIAAALSAEKLILMTDTPGLLRNPKDHTTLISWITTCEVDSLRSRGILSGGMIPKVQACQTALAHGCKSCHIVDGRTPHAVLLEIFTDAGVGTLITSHDTLEDLISQS
ncbi:MAG: acetylglutamate kinase [Candidatus Omnitrophica bacterium]|jgi:N-acetylglutamate kinase (EC 2.7.2.8)|nr:MAG: Acetylglutamate kinase [Candidatus Hinthialibacteria bacterium OLB16]MBE7489930.1 acetylglutamate kinase [bacterium]MBK7496844.1 acetylglutamate kinase [Candidatus Omnitrophota bacterium]MCE7909259.1 acetylglutamate kinase [Candidatus Omnitrophica bacterium COP1]MBV6481412.1 Acetylglutamate kinase [bacterium]